MVFISPISTKHRHGCQGHNPATTSTGCPISVLSMNVNVWLKDTGAACKNNAGSAKGINSKRKQMNWTGRYIRWKSEFIYTKQAKEELNCGQSPLFLNGSY